MINTMYIVMFQLYLIINITYQILKYYNGSVALYNDLCKAVVVILENVTSRVIYNDETLA